jgi:hypothetical protein
MPILKALEQIMVEQDSGCYRLCADFVQVRSVAEAENSVLKCRQCVT